MSAPEIQGRPYPKGEEKELAEACCAQYASWEQGAHRVVVLFGESPQRHYFKEELAAEDITDRVLKHDLKGSVDGLGGSISRTVCGGSLLRIQLIS